MISSLMTPYWGPIEALAGAPARYKQGRRGGLLREALAGPCRVVVSRITHPVPH